mgnify:CR=1 FL=1
MNKLTLILIFLLSVNILYAQYPASNGNINTNDYITYVHIDGVSNYSGANSGGYADFTSSVSGLLGRDESYDLSVSVEFDDNIPYVYISAWIDWNHDQDFDDAGEEYIIATNVNTRGPHTINITVPSGATLGATRMRVTYRWDSQPSSSGTFPFGEVEDYKVIVTDTGPLTYNSTDVFQETGYAQQGGSDQTILKIVVGISGETGSLNAEYFTFNTNGCDDAANDISRARVYYTGTENTFSTDNQFGSDHDSPDGSFTINGSQSLYPENNYFWLVYDISGSATISNDIDAECTQLGVGGSNYTPTNGDPSGNKEILGSPTVTTDNVTNVTAFSCDAGGNVTNDGGSSISERGVCWSTEPNPTIDDNKLAIGSGTGSFSGMIEFLQYNTQYYLRAYAINSGFTGYGQERTFTTVDDPHYWIEQDITTGGAYISLLPTDQSGQSFKSVYSGLITDIQIWVDDPFTNATLRLFYGEQDGSGPPFYTQSGISGSSTGERWHNIHLDNRFFMFANSQYTFDINKVKWLVQSGNPYQDGRFRNNTTWDNDLDWTFRIRVEYAADIVYVNTAWAGSSEGDDLGNGKIFGQNAFDNIIDGLDEVAIGGLVVIETEGNTTIADLDLTYKDIRIRLDGGNLEVTNSFTVADQYILTPGSGNFVQHWSPGDSPLFFPVKYRSNFTADITLVPNSAGSVKIRAINGDYFNAKSDCGFNYEPSPAISHSSVTYTFSADRDLDPNRSNLFYDPTRTRSGEWSSYLESPATAYDTDENLFTSTFQIQDIAWYAFFGDNIPLPVPWWALAIFGTLLAGTGIYYIRKYL